MHFASIQLSWGKIIAILAPELCSIQLNRFTYVNADWGKLREASALWVAGPQSVFTLMHIYIGSVALLWHNAKVLALLESEVWNH